MELYPKTDPAKNRVFWPCSPRPPSWQPSRRRGQAAYALNRAFPRRPLKNRIIARLRMPNSLINREKSVVIRRSLFGRRHRFIDHRHKDPRDEHFQQTVQHPSEDDDIRDRQ